MKSWLIYLFRKLAGLPRTEQAKPDPARTMIVSTPGELAEAVRLVNEGKIDFIQGSNHVSSISSAKV